MKMKLKLKKDGLQGEELKFMTDLESRFEEIETKGLDEAKVKELQTKAFEEAFEPYKKLKEISIEKIAELLDEKTGYKAIALKQADEINKIKAGRGIAEDENKSIRMQIKEWVETNKDAIAKVKSKESKELPEMKLKVASPMTPANTLNSSAYLPRPEFEAGIHDLRRIQSTFWDYIPKGRTGQAAYVWVNKKNPLGAAAFIGPGVAKPGISFEIETEISNAKKIAESIKIATELLDDIDGMETFVRQEMAYKLDAKTNTTLMTGTLSSTVPAGIQTISQLFATSGLATTNPTIQDCIRSVVAQIRVNFIPGLLTAFINPIDAANMDMQKATDSGVYLMPPFSTADGKQISGCLVVEDVNVAVGYVQVAALDLFRVLIYQDYVLKFGWENTDFTDNLVTAIGERRLHSFHSAVDAQAFVYDSFANIKTAITLP